ncbi:MAG: hypothetical protein MUE56_05815 [Ignavibacteria bacterium]|nr:hypothetical protein [Ignavibacteria bacterium]
MATGSQKQVLVIKSAVDLNRYNTSDKSYVKACVNMIHEFQHGWITMEYASANSGQLLDPVIQHKIMSRPDFTMGRINFIRELDSKYGWNLSNDDINEMAISFDGYDYQSTQKTGANDGQVILPPK